MTRGKWMAVLGAALVLAAAAPLLAAELFDPAAPLKIAKWVKGQPVDVKDGKHVYVIEFWATWCGPCRVSIPHLTELQKKYKDKGVVLVGVSDETEAKVKPFVEKQGEKMDYRVAIDDERGTSKGYMQAFNVGGIPHAFIVDKSGKMVWHGHPMGGELENVLDQVIAGTYTKDAAKDSKKKGKP